MGRQRRPALAAGLCAAVAVAVVAVMLIGTRWHGGGAMRDTELAAAVVSGPQVIYLKRARGIGGADAKTTALEGDADAADDAEEGGGAGAESAEEDSGEGGGEEEEEEDEEGGEPQAPEPALMGRAQREVRAAKETRARLQDPDASGLQEPHDHWYYSGPAVHRKVDMTDVRERPAPAAWDEEGVSRGVSSIPDTYTGAAVSSQQAMYKPKPAPIEHDVMKDVDLANIERPTRVMIARALQHVESKEIQTEYFHDTLADNDPHSWRYQEHIRVHNVPGSRAADNSMLAYNGVGGIFGPGAMLGPADPREEIPLRAIKKGSAGSDTLSWTDKEVLDTERVLKAGTSFTDKPRSGNTSPSGFNRNHDVAQAILRRSDPDYDIKADTFLNYNPANPPAKDDPTLFIHSWAAYTPEGSKRRQEAARGQLAYEEWRKTHPWQADAAEHGVGCFHGKLPCKDDRHDILIHRDPALDEAGGTAGGGAGGEGETEPVESK